MMKPYMTPDEIIGMLANSEEAARDIAYFNNAPLGDLIISLQQALAGTHQGLMYFGVVATPKRVNKELGRMTRGYNHGRRKGVSLKRPSPRLSKHDQDMYHTRAIVNLAEW